MGTYTTNYNLFMPSVGEQGWGELVNGNFATIDTTMSGLNTRMGTAETNITSLTTRMGTAETTIASNKSRIGTLETDTNAVEARVTVLENGEFNGEVSAETFNGALYVNGSYEDTGIGSYEIISSASETSNTGNNGSNKTITINSGNITINDIVYTKKKGFEFDIFPIKLSINVIGDMHNLGSSRSITLELYKNNVLVNSTVANTSTSRTDSYEILVQKEDVIHVIGTCNFSNTYNRDFTVKLVITKGLAGNIYFG